MFHIFGSVFTSTTEDASSFQGHFPPGIRIKVDRAHGTLEVDGGSLVYLRAASRTFQNESYRRKQEGEHLEKMLLTPGPLIFSSPSAAHNHSKAPRSLGTDRRPRLVQSPPGHKTRLTAAPLFLVQW